MIHEHHVDNMTSTSVVQICSCVPQMFLQKCLMFKSCFV